MNLLAYISLSIGFQLIAAFCGSYYIRRINKKEKWNKFLVSFLWLTVAVEIIALYAAAGYYSDYKYFSFIKDTRFADNSWMYNIFLIINFTFLTAYFRSFIEDYRIQRILKILISTYVIVAVGYLLSTDVFFKYFSWVSVVFGSILLIISILFFYFHILKGEKVLQLKGYLPFYISIGCGIFYLCTTPLFLYTNSLSVEDELFLNFYRYVLFFGNIFMYLFYSISFILCSKERK